MIKNLSIDKNNNKGLCKNITLVMYFLPDCNDGIFIHLKVLFHFKIRHFLQILFGLGLGKHGKAAFLLKIIMGGYKSFDVPPGLRRQKRLETPEISTAR